MNWLLRIFGCQHVRTTRPMTLKRRTWVTCLSCGQEFAYDFTAMKQGPALRPEPRTVIVGPALEAQ